LDNRNKRGMSLDLKSAHARTVVERLVKWADVLVINFPHPARKRLKLTYEEVAAWNPRLITRTSPAMATTDPTPISRI